MLSCLLTAILLTTDAANATAWPLAVQTMDGRAVSGELVALDNKNLVIRHDGQEESIEVAKLLGVDLPATEAKAATVVPAAPIIVSLLDDSRLAAQEFSATPEKAQFKLVDGSTAEVPTSGVAWVRFPSPAAEIAAEWERILSTEAAADILVVRKLPALDYLEGIIRSVKPDAVEFEVDGDVVQAKLAKIEGLRFYHRSERKLPESVCRVVRAGGSELQASELKFADGRLEVQTPVGLKIPLTAADVQRLDFSQGKLVFLSDLDWDPQLYERQAYFGGGRPIEAGLDLFPPQRDRALDGGPLELDRQSYAKGLAMHSRTKLVYRLPAAYRRFLATAGIDDRAGKEGDVRLVIEGDGRQLFAANVRGGEKPTPIDLDISGVKRLSILADFGLDLDIADHLDLVEARVVK